MKEILEKITSYNFFNHLFPGILFVVLLKESTQYYFIQENLVIGAFVYYFVGLVISRFGSLIIEPLLKKISFLKFAAYSDFIHASKSDFKIETLSETNNMYRTLVSMLFLLLLFKTYEMLTFRLPTLSGYSLYILVTLLLMIFLFSYRKQTIYIRKRVGIHKSQITS